MSLKINSYNYCHVAPRHQWVKSMSPVNVTACVIFCFLHIPLPCDMMQASCYHANQSPSSPASATSLPLPELPWQVDSFTVSLHSLYSRQNYLPMASKNKSGYMSPQLQFNSLWPCDTIWRHRSGSPITLAQVMVATSNGFWCMGIKGEMSGTVCVTFTWDMYIYMSCL